MSTHANRSTPARRTQGALVAACVVLLAGLLATTANAQTPTPYQDIASSGPLTHVYTGNDTSCQVAHTGDALNEVYPPSSIPGSCGTFVFVNGTLYAPDFNNHGGSATGSIGQYTAFTPVSQSPVSGAGTTANPYVVTTVVDVGTTGLRITQVDKYVVGQESYRSDITITNNSGAALSGIVYRAADCYLQGNDRGFGFVDPANGAAGCSINANNSPAGRIEQWFPITAGANYMEAGFSTVWGAIGAHTAFPNTCECTTLLDNGAGISWNFSVAPAGSSTFAHYTTFSPQGVAGPPPPPSSGTPPAFGPGGVVVAPSNRQCVSRRHFKIKVRNRPGNIVVNAEIFVNGRRVQTYYVNGKLRGRISMLARSLAGEIAAKFNSLKGRRIGANVDLRGLPKGTVFVRIIAITDSGSVIQGKRKYHTCVPKRRGGNPKL
jgi:hypothetical protein